MIIIYSFNSHHALQDRLIVDQKTEAVLIVLIQIVNLRVYQIQPWFVHSEFTIIGEREVPVHIEFGYPIARLPCLEDAIAVSHSPVAGVLVLRREERAIRTIVNSVNLPWCT